MIYGVQKHSTVIHVGMITAVEERDNGVYAVQTVEGNVSNRIKRYHYLYDSRAEDPTDNMRALPAEERTEEDVYQYDPHQDDWYITTFCMTWF